MGFVGGPTKPNEDANRWLVGATVASLGNRWESQSKLTNGNAAMPRGRAPCGATLARGRMLESAHVAQSYNRLRLSRQSIFVIEESSSKIMVILNGRKSRSGPCYGTAAEQENSCFQHFSREWTWSRGWTLRDRETHTHDSINLVATLTLTSVKYKTQRQQQILSHHQPTSDENTTVSGVGTSDPRV